jgi:hypothetical protein
MTVQPAGRWRWVLCGVLVVIALAAASFSAVQARFSGSAGPAWRPEGLQGILVHSLAAGHRDGTLLFAGAHGGVYRRDGRGAWRRMLRSGDIWDIDLLADDSTVLAAANDGTIAVSRDGGAHWRRSLVSAAGAYAVTAVPGDSGVILAGAAGGLYRSVDGGRRWQRELATPGSAGDAFVWAPGSRRVVFAGVVAGSPGGSTSVFVSRDAGAHWTVYGHGLRSLSGVMAVAVTSRSSVLAGTMGNALWVTGADGQVWRKVTEVFPPTGDHVAALAADPGTISTIFAGTLGFGVFQSTDTGRHWRNITGDLPASHFATTVLGLVYVPWSHTLYAGTADGVYRLSVGQGRSGS